MTPERKNNLLGYIDQLKALSGTPLGVQEGLRAIQQVKKVMQKEAPWKLIP